jgi:hypothetical protein
VALTGISLVSVGSLGQVGAPRQREAGVAVQGQGSGTAVLLWEVIVDQAWDTRTSGSLQCSTMAVNVNLAPADEHLLVVV